MIRNDSRELIFEVLLNRERSKVIGWLKQKYTSFRITECEDIFQEGSFVLWKKFQTMLDMSERSFSSQLYAICRNISTHYLRNLPLQQEWEDRYYPEEVQVERDFDYISPGIAHLLKKERLYDEISRLNAKDQMIIQGYILGKHMKEIAREAQLGSEQSAKNKKTKIVVRLRNAINGQAHQDACPSFFTPNQRKMKVFPKISLDLQLLFRKSMVYVIPDIVKP